MKTALLIIMGAVLFTIAVLLCDPPAYAPAPLPASSRQHQHVWSKWSAPEVTSNWYAGTRHWQSRTCETCGEAELKVVQVAPNAK